MYDYVFKHFATTNLERAGQRRCHLACDAKRGNCTDFHSLFIAMARSEKIPSRFEIGFSIPTTSLRRHRGLPLLGRLYTPDLGWVPVDISEAWKHQEKHDYFFGSATADRVQLPWAATCA